MKALATTLIVLAGSLVQASALPTVTWQNVQSEVRAAHSNKQFVLRIETHTVRPGLHDVRDAYTFGYAGAVAVLERVDITPSGSRIIAAQFLDGKREWIFTFAEERVPGSAPWQAVFRTEPVVQGMLTTLTGTYRLGLALIVDLDFQGGVTFERTDQENQWQVSGTLTNGERIESLLREDRSWSAVKTVVTSADGSRRRVFTVLDGSWHGNLYFPTRTRRELLKRDGGEWTLANTITVTGQIEAIAQNGLSFFTPHPLAAGRTVLSDAGDEYVINEQGEPIRK